MTRRTDDLQRLVAAARRGDESAWSELVRRFTPAVRRAAYGFGLNAHDAEDVVQITWLQAYRNLRRLREPEALGLWLRTTARRNALRLRQVGVAEILTATPEDADVPAAADVWDEVLRDQRATAVRDAVRRLTPRQRQILEALLAEDADYGRVAARLSVPIGSIGPTRARCLARLRDDAVLARAVAA